MAKPPKPITPNTSPDVTTTTRPMTDSLPNNSWNAGTSDSSMPGIHQLSETSTTTLPGNHSSEPSVIVTRITDPVLTDLNTRLREISWPGLQSHLLRPHDFVDGFYVDPKGEVYAHLDEGGYYRAELNANGEYQIPWPEAPGVTPPILKKIQGQPRWRVEAAWYSPPPAPLRSAMATITRVPMRFLEPHLAATLSKPELSADALRHNKLKQSFVDTAEGTVMVRKSEAGQYYLASATGPDAPDTVFERIAESHLWRLKSQGDASAREALPSGTRRPPGDPDESGPGTSKRSRLEEAHPALAASGRTLPTADWRTWGNTTKPSAGESIEIDGKHYSIVTQPTYANDALVFIKHPQFSADRFDAFEQLLLTTPDLQPRGAIKDTSQGSTGDQWKVVDGLPFKKPIMQYVADAFPPVTDHSVSTIATALFKKANHGEAMNGYGLNDLFHTVNYWADRPRNSEQVFHRQDLADPLTLLTPLSKDATGYMHLPSHSAEGFYRVDFDSQRIPGEWSRLTSGSSPRAVFKAVLGQQGYDVSASFRQTQRDALMFRQTGVDALFVMLFGQFESDRIFRENPKDWVRAKALRNLITVADKLTLSRHLGTNKIIYLLGSFNILPAGQGSLTITKSL